ncbi:hypothetical protein HNY73_016544 [Argiope bruennichi]|uniref:Uncharacterized protein n=1 Tax=Argiope bruennichi TaxID=94029 RepID=A0A8T0EK16_ARGBR|nr:hypothetical protein HNY73_016544 [Argiope bruennichi]
MEVNSLLILEELHYHRVFIRTDGQPTILDVEPIVSTAEVVTFISDALDYALFIRGIEGFISPLDTGEIQKNNAVKRYFNFDIGDAIAHECAVEVSRRIVLENGFDVDIFLDLPKAEAMKYAKRFIGLVIFKSRPVNTSFINALAFSSTLCCVAAENNRLNWMNCIALSAVFIFQAYFPYEWIYFDFKHWAFTYVFRHKQIHHG